MAVPPIADAAKPESRFDRRLRRAVSFAQIATPVIAFGGVLLAAWGYVHTVLPVIQFQRLKEQATQLEIDNAQASDKLKHALQDLQQTRQEQLEARHQQEKVAAETRRLNDALVRAQAETHRLSISADTAKLNERLANNRAQQSLSVLQRQQVELEKNRWEIVGNSVSFSLVPILLNQAISFANSNDQKTFILEEAKNWPQPREAVLTAITNASRMAPATDIQPKYFQELRDAVDARPDLWRCETPDFKKMQTDYSAELASLSPAIDRQLEEYLAKVAKDKSSPDSTVVITDTFRFAARKSFQTSEEYRIRTKFENQLQAMRKVCDDAAFKGLAAIFSAKQAAAEALGSALPVK